MLFPLLEPDYDCDDWIDEILMDCYVGGRHDLLLRDANNFERYPRLQCIDSDKSDTRENDIQGDEELERDDELHRKWRDSNIERIERIDTLRLECCDMPDALERYKKYSNLPRWMGNILMRSVADTKLGVYDSDDEDEDDADEELDERARPRQRNDEYEREIDRYRRFSRRSRSSARSSRRSAK